MKNSYYKVLTTVLIMVISVLGLFGLYTSAQALAYQPANKTLLADESRLSNDCIVPTPGMTIYEDTKLCPGTYSLTGEMQTFITFGASDITLDCDGAVLDGQSLYAGIGVYIPEQYSTNTVKNCNFQNIDYRSIHLDRSDYNTIENNDFTTVSSTIFIDLEINSDYNIIRDNHFHDGSVLYGISVRYGGQYNELYSNTFTNLISTGGEAIGIYMTSNLSTEPHVGPEYNTIRNNSFDTVEICIMLEFATAYNDIYENTITNSLWNGILLNGYYISSIDTALAPYENTIHDNSIINSSRGIVLTDGTHHNQISNNLINISYFGIQFYSYPGDGNIYENEFIANTIINAAVTGIEIYPLGIDNTFALNDFKLNVIHASDHGTGNQFDNGSRGNFWDDFDEPYEGCIDSDINGTCDDPYPGIDGPAGNVDYYPQTGAPIIEPISDQAIDEGQTLQLTVNVTDGNGPISALSASYPSGAFGASFVDNEDNTGTFTWKPWYDQADIGYEVVFSASDGIHTDEDTVLIDVTNYIVPPPTITLDVSTQTAVAGQAFTLTVSGSSEEALASVWWGVREPGNYAYDVIPGSVDGIPVNLAPAQGFGACKGETYCEFTRTVIIDEPGDYEIWANSRDTIYFTVTGEPHQASEGLGIPIIEINVAPAFSATPGPIAASLGSPVNFNISAHDENGDVLNLEMVQSAPGATFSAGETVANADGTGTISGNFSWTPNSKHSGSYTVQFQVTDDNSAVVLSAPVEIFVRNLRAEVIK